MKIDDFIVINFIIFALLSFHAPLFWMRYASMMVTLIVLVVYCFIIEYETRKGIR